MSLIDYAEKGFLPDFLIRFGIRKLCMERLLIANRMGVEEVEIYHQKFIEELKNSPIAIVPEKANDQHYEVPSDFFEIVLGKNLKYSSALWNKNSTNLIKL